MRFTTILRLLILICFFSSATYSQVKIGPKPAFVEDLPEFSSKLSQKDASDGWLYSIRDIQIDVPTQTYFQHYKRKIFTETGVQNASEITLVYDPVYEKIVFHTIYLIRGNEKINHLDLKKIKVIQQENNKEKHLYDGSLTAFLVLEDVRVGDEIEYSYSVVGMNPIYKGKFSYSHYLGFYDKSDQLMLSVHVPKLSPLKSKVYNTKIQPKEEEIGDRKRFKIYLENIEGTICDTDLPSWYDPYPWIEYSEFQSWTEVKNSISPHYQVPQATVGLAQIVDTLKSKFTNREDLLVAATRLVQNEIRYVGNESGIGGYKPELPDRVLSQRFGDCKGKSLLLCTLLKALEFEAYPAFVNTYQKHELLNRLPSPGLFNHCIVVVRINFQEFWYDPTANYQGGKYNSTYLPDYKTALVFDSSASLSNIQYQRLSKTIITESYFVKEIGKGANLKVETKYYGGEADNQRYYFTATHQKQIEKNYLNFYAASYPDIELDGNVTYKDNLDSNVFTVSEHYNIPKFWVVPDTSKPSKMETAQYAQVLRDKISIPTNKLRSMPLSIEYPLDMLHEIVYHLPEDWNIEEKSGEIAAPGINFRYDYSYIDKIISIQYELVSSKNFIEAAQTPEYIKKMQEIMDKLGYSLQYNSQAEPQAFSVNTVTVLIAIISLMIAVPGAILVYKYNPPAYWEAEKALGGWLLLPLIGLVITVFRTLSALWDANYYDESVWLTITDKSSATYNPMLTGIFVGEMVYSIFFLVFSSLVLYLFMNKRSSVPKLMVIFYSVSLIALSAEFLLGRISNIELEGNTGKELLRSFFAAIIWIPYFSVSLRCKETFTNILVAED